MTTPLGPSYEVKTRDITYHGPTYGTRSAKTEVPGQPATASYAEHRFAGVGRQTTTSRDNGYYAHRKLLNRLKSGEAVANPGVVRLIEQRDVGSQFETLKQEYELRSPVQLHKAKYGYTEYIYRGPFGAVGQGEILPTSMYYPAYVPPHIDYLHSLGATAISRCLPTNPAADLATFLGELREGLPSLVGLTTLKNIPKLDAKFSALSLKRRRRTERPDDRLLEKPGKSAGGEYLNYQFGIKPLLADVRKLNDAVCKADKIIEQYLRDSGRLIRRRYTFPVTESEEVLWTKTGQALFPTLPTQMYQNWSQTTGTLTLSRKTTIESWFSGGFTYYVEQDDDTLSKLRRQAALVRRVYGAELTPEVAWNLAPWSWAVDWFTNVGDVFHNASRFAADGLVMRYGYLMYKETIEDTYTHAGVNLVDYPTGVVSQTFRTVYKRRVKAHPYGFGYSDLDLSPRQLAILAALGISRGRAD